MPKRERKLVANNKKARHDYFIEEVYEAGIVLTGTEIKSVRQGKVSIKESYAKIENMEMILYGLNISPYEQGNRFNVDPLRPKKLLLHKQEIRKLIGYTTQKGLTLVPLTMYINEDGRAKVEIAVARGKKNYDKRDDIATLRTLGAKQSLVQAIFANEGRLMALISLTVGVVIGIALTLTQQYLGVVRLNTSTLLVDAYPVELHLWDVVATIAAYITIAHIIIRVTVRQTLKTTVYEENV